jgi:hypothetical protein
MKTPQEAAREYTQNILDVSDLSVNHEEDNYDAGVMNTLIEALEPAFLAGDAFGYRRGMEKACQWINVEDELPKDQDDVLVLFCNGRKGIGSYVGNNEWAIVIASEYDSQDLKVVAWRPIEPIKE